MSYSDKYTLDELKSRWLDIAARRSFEEFAEIHDVPELHQRSLVQLTGRGYRPPTDHAGWVKIYGFWKSIHEEANL